MDTAKVAIVGAALFIVAAIITTTVLGIATINMQERTTGTTGNTAAGSTGQGASGTGTQQATLRMNGAQYIVEPSTLQPNVPVRMTVDTSTVTGCMRQVVIPAFGVNQYVTPQNNVITFTPTKAGTFTITCGMGMGRGTFQVGSGAAAAQVDTTPLPSGSCGAAGGGCGCGGAR